MSRRRLITTGAAAAAGASAVSLIDAPSADAWFWRRELVANPNFYPRDGVGGEIDMTGKVVVITGASRGIGLATGVALQALGAVVLGTSRVPGAHLNHPFPLLELDLEDQASVAAFLGAVQTRPEVTSNGGIDVLFNNAGRFVLGNPIALDPATYFPALERSLAVLYGGHVAVANGLLQALAARAAASGYARMAFTTSVVAYGVGGTEPGLSLYHAYYSGKRALLSFANCLRGVVDAGGLGIGVSTVNPLAVQTALAEGLNPIFVQPVDGNGNSSDPDFQLFLDQIRLGLANGLPVEFAAEGIVQLLTSASPDPNIAIGSNEEPFATQGQTEFAEQIGLAENAESAYGYAIGRRRRR
ncbi:MAG: SDR family NAD(P)-dependent oxidoreductase [Actinomycetota bacterium]